jgi:hypothetical protein
MTEINAIHAHAATIQGRDHLLKRTNAQDAYALHVTPVGVVAIVCDGCGSGRHSEVGAALVAHFAAERAVALLNAS